MNNDIIVTDLYEPADFNMVMNVKFEKEYFETSLSKVIENINNRNSQNGWALLIPEDKIIGSNPLAKLKTEIIHGEEKESLPYHYGKITKNRLITGDLDQTPYTFNKAIDLWLVILSIRDECIKILMNYKEAKIKNDNERMLMYYAQFVYVFTRGYETCIFSEGYFFGVCTISELEPGVSHRYIEFDSEKYYRSEKICEYVFEKIRDIALKLMEFSSKVYIVDYEKRTY